MIGAFAILIGALAAWLFTTTRSSAVTLLIVVSVVVGLIGGAVVAPLIAGRQQLQRHVVRSPSD